MKRVVQRVLVVIAVHLLTFSSTAQDGRTTVDSTLTTSVKLATINESAKNRIKDTQLHTYPQASRFRYCTLDLELNWQ